MSKLTDCQIRSTIAGMEKTLDGALSRGDVVAAQRLNKKIAQYLAELRDRAAGLAVQEPQADNRRAC